MDGPTLPPSQWSLLELVRDQPWVTPSQIARWLRRAFSRVEADLRMSLNAHLIQRVNPRSPHIPARAVYALTDPGIVTLAERARISLAEYACRYQLSRQRLAELLWCLDRVYRVRNLLLDLPRAGESICDIKIETDELIVTPRKQFVVHLYARAYLQDENGLRIPFAVIWDRDGLALQSEFPDHLIRWQSDVRWWSGSGEGGLVFLFVLDSSDALLETWIQLHHAAFKLRLAVPNAFLGSVCKIEISV